MPDDNRPLSQGEIDALLQALSTNPVDSETTVVEPEIPTSAADTETVPESAPAPRRPRHARPDAPIPVDDPRLRRTMHLPVTMFVSLGDKNLPIRSLLNWGVGTQISLNREWQRDVGIKVNGLEVGQGRVVIVGNNFGIEVTEWGRQE
jgi:flagellar motor switch protein FliN/FliY